MKPALEILYLFVFFRESGSVCNQNELSNCDDILTSDIEAAISIQASVKCRTIRQYMKCLNLHKDCLDEGLHSRITSYMDGIKLICNEVNGDRDIFDLGCRDEDMTHCQEHVQERLHPIILSRDKELFLCKGISWLKQCLVENATCDEQVIDKLAVQSREVHGVTCFGISLNSFHHLVITCAAVALTNILTRR